MKQNTSSCAGKLFPCLSHTMIEFFTSRCSVVKTIILLFSDPNMVSPTSLFHPPSKYTQLQTTTPLGPKPVLFTPTVHSAHVSWLLHLFVMKAVECLKDHLISQIVKGKVQGLMLRPMRSALLRIVFYWGLTFHAFHWKSSPEAWS